jgi:hypothetical protein
VTNALGTFGKGVMKFKETLLSVIQSTKESTAGRQRKFVGSILPSPVKFLKQLEKEF